MPWFVWTCFLTVPVLVGVACTLASDAPDDPKGINTVAVAGGVWLFVAYHLKNYLREQTPRRWPRRWVVLAVALPLVTLFILSLRHDPEVKKLVGPRLEARGKAAPDGLAAAAPARRALTWVETRELVARVQPRAADFGMKLFTSMPPAWWFLALGVGLWRGK